MLSATNLRTYHLRQFFRKFRRRCLPRQCSPLGCRHRILYRIAGQLWCIMVSREIPEQKVARLTDLHNCTFHSYQNLQKYQGILYTFDISAWYSLTGLFYNRFLASESVFPTLLLATISKDAGIFSHAPVAYKNDKTICAKRFPILLQTISQCPENDFRTYWRPSYGLCHAENRIRKKHGQP